MKQQHKNRTTARRLAQKQRRGSVQQRFIAARAVCGPMLCLATPTAGSFDYVSIVQVEGIAYDLKSEEEQAQLLDVYQACLAALSAPIQLMWRLVPFSLLETAHAPAHLLGMDTSLHVMEATSVPIQEDIWEALRRSQRALYTRLAARRTLLERQMYLVLRVSGKQVQRGKHGWWPSRRKREAMQAVEQARHALEVQVSEVSRLLGNLGLTLRQLRGPQELVPFYAACLLPNRAPLPPAVIAGLDRPVQSSQGWHHPVMTREEVVAPLPQRASRESAVPQQATIGALTLTRLEDLVAPAAIALAPDLLQIEGDYARVLVVHQFPRVVTPGWLKPLADLDEPMEVSLHLCPLDSGTMVQQLRRRQMEHSSSRLLAQRQGQTLDPQVKLAEADLETLIERVASGEERLLSLTLLILVRARSKRVLSERTERILSLLHTLQLVSRVAYFEQEQAFRSCLPHAHLLVAARVLLDSTSAATLFPFLAPTLLHPGGLLEGITPAGDPVLLDPWHEEIANANRIILGPPGWGKSYAVKASLIRLSLKYAPTSVKHAATAPAFQVIVLDPEREYGRLADALGGQVIRLAPGSAHHLNPFDLPMPQNQWADAGEHGDRLADHVHTLHRLLELMLADRTPDGIGTLSAQEKGLLDRALYETYREAGIGSDERTHRRSAPLLRDLYRVLESGVCGPDPSGLTPRLRRYVHGSLAGLFAGPTNVNLAETMIVFDLYDLETELRPIGLFLVSNFVWTQSFHSRIPRQLIVDEAATLCQYESGAIFLEDLVRRARKHYLGVTVISQHSAIFQTRSIIANCAVQMLMRQDATALDLVQQLFHLSSREVQILRRLGVGEALLLVGEKRLHLRVEVSEMEHQLATTRPREQAAREEEAIALSEHPTQETDKSAPFHTSMTSEYLENTTQQDPDVLTQTQPRYRAIRLTSTLNTGGPS